MARPYTYKTAEELEKAIEEYFAWADKNPVRVASSSKLRGDAGSEKPSKQESANEYAVRPYTLFEMCDRIHICDWSSFKRDNMEREGFAEIILWAENKIKAQQVTGAMVGIYRENLTARLNGIAEQVQDITPPPSTIEIVVDE